MKEQPTEDTATLCKVTVTDMDGYVLDQRTFQTTAGTIDKPREFWTNRFSMELMDHLERKFEFIADE